MAKAPAPKATAKKMPFGVKGGFPKKGAAGKAPAGKGGVKVNPFTAMLAAKAAKKK